MKKTASFIIGLLFIVCAAIPLRAEDTVHVVKKGDTLWDITKQYLENPWKWPIIWSNNQEITNPHLIYPGDKVVISRNGERTTITIIPANQAENTAPAVYTPKEIEAVKDKSIMISPQYSAYILSPNILTGSGSVIQKVGIGNYAASNETIMIKSASGLILNRGITIVSKVNDIKSKDGIIGYLYKAVAIAVVQEAQSDFFKAAITYATQEVKPGDIILDDLKPIQPLKLTPFEPSLKEAGHVIDMYGGVTGSSFLDLVFLDVGKADGVEPGAIVTLYKEISPEDDKKVVMREYGGMALVFQSLDNTSLALVADSKVPIERGFIAVGRQ